MRLRKFLAFLIMPFPSFLKIFMLRHVFGYVVGPGVRIGFSVVLAEDCQIGANVRIGHFNYIARMKQLRIDRDSIIGHFNIVLGGALVQMGEGAMIGRFNEINSILNPLVRGVPDPCLVLGRRAVITAWHKIDFTDRVTLDESVVLAGRLSNLWTHNRQDVGPVSIGAHCYMGSGIQMVPGTTIGSHCIVGLGAVVTRSFSESHVLIAGVPAKVVKQLDEGSMNLVTFPTRPDLDGMPDIDTDRFDENGA